MNLNLIKDIRHKIIITIVNNSNNNLKLLQILGKNIKIKKIILKYKFLWIVIII